MSEYQILCTELEEVKNDTREPREFIEKMIVLGRLLMRDERMGLAEELLQWAEKKKFEEPSVYYYALTNKAQMSFHSEMYDLALQTAMRARQFFLDAGDEVGIARADLILGGTYRSMEETELAIRYLMEAMDYSKRVQTTEFVFMLSCFSLAEIFVAGGRYPEALDLYHQVIPMENLPMYKNIAGLVQNGIATIYLKQKELDKVPGYLQKGLDESEKAANKPNIARIYTTLGQYYRETGDIDKALDAEQKSLEIRKTMRLDGGIVTNLLDMADIYMQTGKIPSAQNTLEEALDVAEKAGQKAKIYQVHEALSRLYEKEGEYKKALHHYHQYHSLRGELDHEDFEKKLKNQQVAFEAEQTRKENVIIKAQKLEIEEKNIQLQETIDELTITRISRRAKAITLFIGVALLIFEDAIMHFIILPYVHENFLYTLMGNGLVVILLKPIEKVVEQYLLSRLVLKRRKKGAGS